MTGGGVAMVLREFRVKLSVFSKGKGDLGLKCCGMVGWLCEV